MITSERAFIERHQALWQEVERCIDGDARMAQAASEEWLTFPARYRQLCQHLALAEAAGFSATTVEYLNRLAVAGQRLLYQKSAAKTDVATFFLWQLPQALRAQWRYILVSFLIFILTFAVAMCAMFAYPQKFEAQVARYVEMYRPESDDVFFSKRGVVEDVAMFGVYVANNTAIGLRMVATGVFFGVGSAFSLGVNGWHFGIVSAEMIRLGFWHQTYLPFIITHSAFELTAMILAGAIGLGLAKALFLPQRRKRSESVQQMFSAFFPILLTMIGLFLFAAVVEAFWSAQKMAAIVRYSVAGLVWSVVLGYLLWAFCRKAGR